MYGCEIWTIMKAEHQRIDAFALWWWRLLRVPWMARGSSQSILKEIQSWIFIGNTDAEAEAPVLWSPDVKSKLIRKDPDTGKDWRQKRGMTEDEMVGWHYWLDGRVWASSRSWWWIGKPGMLHHGVANSRIWLSDWTIYYVSTYFDLLSLNKKNGIKYN